MSIKSILIIISFFIVMPIFSNGQTGREDIIYDAYAGPIHIQFKKYVNLELKDSISYIQLDLWPSEIGKVYDLQNITIKDTLKLFKFRNDLIEVYKLFIKNDRSNYSWDRSPSYSIYLYEDKEYAYILKGKSKENYCRITKNNLATLIEHLSVINLNTNSVNKWKNIELILSN